MEQGEKGVNGQPMHARFIAEFSRSGVLTHAMWRSEAKRGVFEGNVALRPKLTQNPRLAAEDAVYEVPVITSAIRVHMAVQASSASLDHFGPRLCFSVQISASPTAP